MTMSWEDVWGLHEEAAQQRAAELFLGRLRGDPARERQRYLAAFLRELGRRIRFRPQTLLHMSDAQLATEVRRHAHGLLDDAEWRELFTTYYTTCKCGLMSRFLDLLGVPHDEHGQTDAAIHAPERLEAIVATLAEEYSTEEVARYFSVLRLHNRQAWSFLDRVLPRLLSGQGLHPAAPEPAGGEEEESPAERMSEDFTQLDRVLIEQVIATVAQEERALTPAQLVDLVETVHGLDTGRKRSYFHLGFLDALVPGREPGFDRPEMEDQRREWYLAGLLAGYARQRDAARFRQWTRARREDFSRAAERSGLAGMAMAKTIYPLLLELGLFPEALSLLRGQEQSAGRDMAAATLKKASELLRGGDAAGANSLLIPLQAVVEARRTPMPGQAHLAAEVKRKLGQAMQAQGNFSGAAGMFRQLLSDDFTGGSAELLSDMGLVESGFRSLAEVGLPDAGDRRDNVVQALARGRSYFEQAAGAHGVSAMNANYALGVLHYLACMDPGKGFECTAAARDAAIQHVTDAVTGMMLSPLADVYEQLGLPGRCRFMQAMLLMSQLEPSVLPAAISAWEMVDAGAGRLPQPDLRHFLESAELVDHGHAVRIAESIWRHRTKDALDIILRPEWIGDSSYLRTELVGLARDDRVDAETRWDLWTLLTPSLLRAGERTLAEQGLDAMEALALEKAQRFAGLMLQWLDTPANYDPALSEEDVLRIRYRLLRRLGRDADACCQLRNLFFALRDRRRDEAGQVLELFRETGASVEFYGDLSLPPDDREGEAQQGDAEAALSAGRAVRILFIGGNEIQSRYDDQVREQINATWPGVELRFEHTGWSSNWGREVDRLLRLATEADAVVLMTMMRTLLGRTIRERLNDPPRPWIPCTGTGKEAIIHSIRRAAVVGVRTAACHPH